MANASFPSVEL